MNSNDQFQKQPVRRFDVRASVPRPLRPTPTSTTSAPPVGTPSQAVAPQVWNGNPRVGVGLAQPVGTPAQAMVPQAWNGNPRVGAGLAPPWEEVATLPLVVPSPVSNVRSAVPPPSHQKSWKNRLMVISSIVLALFILLDGLALAVWRFVIIPHSVPNVTLYRVGDLQNVALDIGGGGLVYPLQQLTISYPEAERVLAVLVKAGDHVTANQPLIQLDPSQLNAQIKQAADDVAAAQAYLNSVSASGTAVEIAQAQQQYDRARSRYDALVAEASSPLLNSGNLISPLSGVITTVNVAAGQVVAADTAMLVIMDESTVFVHAKIPLANLGQVQLNQQVVITPTALPNLSFNGTVSAIIPQADSQTDTFEVWVSITKPNNMLLPGMSAFVRIQAPGKAFVVPRLAVLNADSGPTVFVVQNQHAHQQAVDVVGRSTDSIYIDRGLSANDTIVLVGLDNLQDGQQVHVTSIEKP